MRVVSRIVLAAIFVCAFARWSSAQQVTAVLRGTAYDPSGATGVQFSFRGHIKAPHEVLEAGYVSFGNPVDNHWYQIVVQNSKVMLRDLGVLKTKGKSLRETIDHHTRVARSQDAYYKKETAKPRVAAAKAGAGASALPLAASSEARAKSLREFAKTLK